MAPTDVFQSITSGQESGALPDNIKQRGDHPVPRLGIVSRLHNTSFLQVTHLHTRIKAVQYRPTNSTRIRFLGARPKAAGRIRTVYLGLKAVAVFQAGA